MSISRHIVDPLITKISLEIWVDNIKFHEILQEKPFNVSIPPASDNEARSYSHSSACSVNHFYASTIPSINRTLTQALNDLGLTWLPTHVAAWLEVVSHKTTESLGRNSESRDQRRAGWVFWLQGRRRSLQQRI